MRKTKRPYSQIPTLGFCANYTLEEWCWILHYHFMAESRQRGQVVINNLEKYEEKS